MTKRAGCLAALLVVLSSTCSEPTVDQPDLVVTALPTEAQLSNAIPLAAAPAFRGAVHASAPGETHLVYVSMPEATVPGGIKASVRRLGDEVAVSTRMFDGGFDPVAVLAGETDSVEIVVTKAGGETVYSKAPVKPRRPPRVVRTWPPKSKSDTPVNASLIVVFSEPLDEKTVSAATITLYAGQRVISGEVHILEGDGTTVAFTPDALLEPDREYRLVVRASVADVEGEELGEDVVLGFSTGTSQLGPPTTIYVVPDSIALIEGSTYQFRARVFDPDGNLLVRPVTWRSVSPEVSVSSTGLATAMSATGADFFSWPIARIEASVGTLTGSAFIIVTPAPASLAIFPASATIGPNDTLALDVVARNASQSRILVPLTINNSNRAAVTISVPELDAMQLSPFRTAKALAPGTAEITVRSGGLIATTAITVSHQLVPVDTVRVAPARAELKPQETLQLTAWLRDARGTPIYGERAVAWSSDDASVATVNNVGRVTAIANGTATIAATIDGRTSTTSITVSAQPAAPRFTAVYARQLQTCAVTVEGDGYCWGPFGVIEGSHQLLVPALLAGGLNLATAVPHGNVFAGHNLCGRTGTGDVFCWRDYLSLPGRLTDTLRFADFSTSEGSHSCGVTADGRAFCWGANTYGQIGDGTLTARPETPTPVVGGHVFASVTVGRHHSCGVTAAGDAYCWGANTPTTSGSSVYTTSGTGDSTTAVLLTPTPVAGGLAFAQLSAGFRHTCGITTTGKAYCWGANVDGQLGDGTLTRSDVPVAVASPLTFIAISVGITHTCAIATSGATYCWGNNLYGQLGVNGPASSQPVAVQGNVSFTRITLGLDHTCGIDTSGRLYCWGQSDRLGTGATGHRSAPTPVSRPSIP